MRPLDFFRANNVNVFPIRPGTKSPMVETTWIGFTGHVEPPYGVELGPLTVVDGDSSAATAWIRAHLPVTPFRVLTGPHHDPFDPGRGVHFYYRTLPGDVQPAFICRDGLSIEARRSGQYVVGPGSKHPSGCTYKPTDWSWNWLNIPEFPSEFVFNDGSVVGASLLASGAPYEIPDRVQRGMRRHELFRFIRSCKAHSTKEETKAFAAEFAQTVCDPPLTPKDFGGEGPTSWFNRVWNHRDRTGFQAPAIEPDYQPRGLVNAEPDLSGF